MNPTDGIQPTAATGGLESVFSRPGSPAATIGTPDSLRGSQATLDRDINAKGGRVVWKVVAK